MKIIILFVLAGLSLAADFECSKQPKENKECLMYTLEKSKTFLNDTTTFMCKYKDKADVDNDPNYEKLSQRLNETLSCAGCSIDQLLGQKDGLEDTTENVGETANKAGKLAVKLGEELGLSAAAIEMLCKLTSDALTSECLGDLLETKVPDTFKKLCEDPDSLSSQDLRDILTDTGCFADDTVGTKETFKELTDKLGKSVDPVLKSVVELLKIDLVKKGIVNDVLCSLTKGTPLLGGGGGSGGSGGSGGLLDGLLGGGLGR